METRFRAILSGTVFLIGMHAVPTIAQDRIQAFVNSNGRVVLTNLVENPPSAPPARVTPAITGTKNSPAQETSSSLLTLVDTISANHGVDPDLVRAVIRTESNFNRFAVSNKGAMGLMQLIPSTGRRYGVRDFFDPQQNIEGGVRYLKFLLEKFNGNLDLSLAAYNAGENLVQRLGRIPSIPETVNYVRKVRSMYRTRSAPIIPSGSMMTTTAAPEPPMIYKMVDERGVVHFSNIEPPN